MTPNVPNGIGTLGAFKYEIRLMLPNSMEGFLFSPTKKVYFLHL